jgi:hypothetical protein
MPNNRFERDAPPASLTTSVSLKLHVEAVEKPPGPYLP